MWGRYCCLTSFFSDCQYVLGRLVAKTLDLQLAGCEFNSRPRRCRVTTLDKLFTPTCLSRSQWFSDGMIDCGVRGCGQFMFITTATAMYSLGHGLRTLPAVPRSTQASTLCGTVKRVSAFGMSNNNKWRWWMWMVAAIYRQTHNPSWLDLRVGGHPVLSLHASNEQGELSQWPWSWG